MQSAEKSTYLAIDLGAESGRAILGWFEGERLFLKEIHRFQNGGVAVNENLYWDVLRLWHEVKAGLYQAGKEAGDALRSIGVDTWGNDFGLLASDDTLVGNPFHYRDSRTAGILEAAFETVPRDEIYNQTGTQFMECNGLYQLLSMVRDDAPALSIAKTFLNLPDLFNFFLTGSKSNEFTISTTTQCFNPLKGDWAFDLLSSFNIPTHIFGEIVQPGTRLGKLSPTLATEASLPNLNVITGAGHDTACAVAAVPASHAEYIYISSGTWSIMGVVLDRVLINSQTLALGLTNEGGVDNKTRLQKNIMGLWLLRECHRQWAFEGSVYGYDELTRMASEAPAFGSFVIPGDRRFILPGNMPRAIQAFCQETGQVVPENRGAIVRCVLESLALEYRMVADWLDTLNGKRYPIVHIIGGGAKNKLLNQFTANSTGRTVVTGPVEATAIGNILVQALAMGEISSFSEGRAIVGKSFEVEFFEPDDSSAWEEAVVRYARLRNPPRF